MRKFLITKRVRIKARRLARSCYLTCKGDTEAACRMAKERVGEVGSVILMLTISAIILQMIYYAIKIWKAWHMECPSWRPVADEGFELAVGEKFELNPLELAMLRDEMEAADELQ